MKIMETFTTDRVVRSGIGYRYAPVLLTGGVAFLGEEVTKIYESSCGDFEIHRYTFQFLKIGQAQIQFAKFRPFDLSDALYEDVLQFTVEPGEIADTHGGWSAFENLLSDDDDVFEKAVKGHVGVDYTAIKVSKLLVNGTNYRFFCIGKVADKENSSFPAIVKVYQPVNGNAVITGIERVVS